MISLTDDRRMLGYGLLSPYSNICHFVTTRIGGAGKGAYGSFNCSPYSGDEAEAVLQNQRLLCEALPCSAEQLVIPLQTHGVKIAVVDAELIAQRLESRQELLHGVDALVTQEPGCCICISTADCVPVLLYDKKHRVVAAVHAGWRGTVHYILGLTLERMRTLYGTDGQDVIACIGPSISLESFEVGDEVCESFRLNGFDMNRISIFKEETRKYHIDLWEANRLQLLDFGVPGSQIEVSGICTYMRHEEFFSARRLGIKSGRILSGIMLREE